MDNTLFLLKAPSGGGTKIVLNKQSDLILHEAEIIKPIGIEEADIAGLVAHFDSVEKAINSEEKARVEGDDRLAADLEAEAKLRTEADTLLNAGIEENKAEIKSEIARAKAKDAEHDEAIATEKSRIDTILDGSTIELDQFKEIVDFVEAIDLENDNSLISAIDKVNAEHKADMESEAKARTEADLEIIATIGYADRGDASAEAFDTYANEVSAEVESNGSSPFAPINEVNFEAWKAAQEESRLKETAANLEDAIKKEAEASVDRDSEIIATIGYDDRGDASAEAFDTYANEVSAEVESNGYSPFAPINEVNFEAWKAAQETVELKGIAANLEDAIKKEAEASVDRDSEIIASVGYDDRGDASAEAFDTYANEVSAEVESNGSSPFAPINEVNFEAWKAAREDAQLKEVDAKLEDAIVTLEEDYISEDDKIIAAVGYRDRGDASAQAFDTYASEVSAEVEANGSSPFAPINEVNFEAWKAAQEESQLKEEVNQLNDTNKKQDEKAAAFEEATNTALEAEAKNRAEADEALDATIKEETARAKAKDAEHDEAIATEKSRIDAILESAALTADTFVEVVNLINSVDTENDQVFGAYAIKTDAAIEELHDINKKQDEVRASEISRLEDEEITPLRVESRDADEALDAAIKEETARAKAKDAEHDAALESEAKLRSEADAALQAGLDGEIADRKSALEAEAKLRAESDALIETTLNNKVAELQDVNKAQDEKVAQFQVETGENFAKLNDELSAEIKRATEAELSLASDVADIIENTDVSKIDSFVEVINEINEKSAANFDSIYAKKVSVSFDGKEQVSLATPVKPESMMLYINGLMVENGVDYTELVEGGMVSGAVLLGDALELAEAGAKLASYGVHGSFTSIEFIGIDYAKLIADKEAEIAKIEAEITEVTAQEAKEVAEFEAFLDKVNADIDAAVAAGDTATADSLTDLVATETAVRQEDKAWSEDFIAQLQENLSKVKQELAQLKKDAAEA